MLKSMQEGRWPERTVLVGAVLAWAAALSLAGSSAHAHDPNNYWAAEWQSQNRGTTDQDYEFTQQVPGGANGPWGDRVAEGGTKWNDVNINGPDMRYRRNGVVSNYNPYQDCIDLGVFRNGIHYRDTPNDSNARTSVCTTWLGQFYIRSFQMVFDDDQGPWYTEPTGSTIDPGDNDVGSVATHEFGHASSGWTNGSVLGHFVHDRNAALCPEPPTQAWHTMCSPSLPGRVWRRTLEEHDIDSIQEAYA
jgi:hypothetical protein